MPCGPAGLCYLSAIRWEIAIANADGSSEQVVSAGDAGNDRAGYLEEDRGPAWSPDGSMLVFMSQTQVPACCGPWQIWAVNRDGTGATNLTNDETQNDMFPSWSPDGTQIVFSRSNGAGGMDLYTMPAPTSLPLAAPAPAAARQLALATAAAGEATRPTRDGNVDDPDWGRNPDAPVTEQQYSLFVSIVPIGRGACGFVASKPAGIWCGADCSQAYPSDTQVTLLAVPKRGSAFIGWTGACTGSARTCTVPMSDVRMTKARFLRQR